MDLDALALFHLVAAHGGFGRAARASGRPKATLSRRVAELETNVGRRLFDRGGGSLRLTDDGRALLASTQGPLDELQATEALFTACGELSGKLRVSAPLLIATHALGALAARFLAAHPRVRLEIVAEDRYVDLVQEGFDIAIRANPRPDDELVGRCFLRDQMLVVAPTTLARPEAGADGALATVPAVVRTSGNDATTWWIDDDGVRSTIEPEPVLRLSSLSIIRDAVLAGAGAALLPCFLVRDHLASGALVRWGVAVDHKVEIWVLHASARLASAKVRAFIDLLFDSFPDASLEQALPAIRPERTAGRP